MPEPTRATARRRASDPSARRLCVLVSVAHPDDEAFGVGGTLAMLADRGATTHLVFATRGEKGKVFDPDMDTPKSAAEMGRLREAEARCAAAALGVATVEFLGYQDGELAEADAGALARAVARALRQHRPDVVITFGPEGIYGHPDHIAIGLATGEAFGLAADEGVDIDGLQAHAAARLFHQVISAALADGFNTEMGPVTIDGKQYPFVGYAEHRITTRVDATEYSGAKLEALRCHRSQTAQHVDEMEDWSDTEPAVEVFILAHARVPDAAGLETDLLAGIA